MVFLSLFFIPALIALGMFIFTKRKITLKEFLLQMVIQSAIAGISVWIIFNANTGDTELLNGQVTKKYKDRVSCEHSYRCRCRQECTGSGNNRRCSEVCDTCYEHYNDYDWVVNSTVGSLRIDRIDRQGTRTPPRWTKVIIGEPFTRYHRYTNYIKASPDSLLRHQGLVEKYKQSIHSYPRVYDYYRSNKLVTVKGNVEDKDLWNKDLSELNKELGSKKEVNIIVVLAFNLPQEYFHALKQAWIGGKKNDNITVIGLDDDLNIQWTSIMSWSDKELYKVKLRDEIMSLNKLDRKEVLKLVRKHTLNGFVRKPMNDFKYLEASITPSMTQYLISVIIGVLCSLGLSYAFFREDIC